MAHQNFCLETLFHYVVLHKEVKLNRIAQHFESKISEVLPALKSLKDMGLPLIINTEIIATNHLISPLDVELIKSLCRPNIHYYFSTDSTNTHAKKSTEDAVFIAEHQTQARGQRGKSWLTPLGQSIALSLSSTFKCSLSHLSGLNIAIGVAVIKTLKLYTNKPISLKWPNDIIGESGKIAGILIEAQGRPTTSKACIGVGINWNIADYLLDSINQPCMNAEIQTVSRSQFIAHLITEINQVIDEFKSNKLKNLIAQWNKFDSLTKQPIHVTESTNSFDATYLKVTANGALQVQVDKEKKLISSASIKLL